MAKPPEPAPLLCQIGTIGPDAVLLVELAFEGVCLSIGASGNHLSSTRVGEFAT